MIILGLTGSLGMGKSTVAAMFRRLGVPVHDSDAAVHRLMAPGGGAVAQVEAAFPGVTRRGGGIDRAALGARVFANEAALRRLERILHPLVRLSQQRFLAAARRRRAGLVVLDVPLLFETGGERRCDKVVVVSAPAFLQRQRVMKRPGMTEERLGAVLAKQMPDAEKRRRADYVVPSGLGRAETFRRLQRIVAALREADACTDESR
ncbi:MAG TPA: dephospho-CoA kinase [Stellaceae bacterium]|nr:dephospho-CoA kinase [Stellaceae bacterium]